MFQFSAIVLSSKNNFIWMLQGVAIMNRRLLTNRLHGKAAELCLANSQSNSVTTAKVTV